MHLFSGLCCYFMYFWIVLLMKPCKNTFTQLTKKVTSLDSIAGGGAGGDGPHAGRSALGGV